MINGVLQINPFDLNRELANLTQIEILKGPQGAIYGLNGVAGAIIIKTKEPGRRFDGDATVGYGNHNTQVAHFWVSGPPTKHISAGISGFYRETSGSFYNSYLHRNNCADYYDEKGRRTAGDHPLQPPRNARHHGQVLARQGRRAPLAACRT